MNPGRGCDRMTVVLLGRARGGQGHPGARPGRAPRRPDPRLRRPPAGRRRAPARRSGARRDRYMERGQLVPDDTIVRVFLDRLEAADAARRRDPRRLPADPRPGRGARRGARRGRTPRRRAPSTSTSRSRISSSAWPTAGSARPTATSTTSPPTRRRSRASATSTARRSSSATMTRKRRSGRGWPNRSRRCSMSSTTTASRGILQTVDGRRRHRRASRTPRSPTLGLPAGDRLTMVTRKSRAEIERMRRAGRVVAEVLALIEARAQAGRLHGRARPPGRGAHPQVGRDPVVQGLSRPQPAPPVPGQRVHLDRRRDRPRHPGRADHPHRPDRVGRRRGDRRRLAWRWRPGPSTSASRRPRWPT